MHYFSSMYRACWSLNETHFSQVSPGTYKYLKQQRFYRTQFIKQNLSNQMTDHKNVIRLIVKFVKLNDRSLSETCVQGRALTMALKKTCLCIGAGASTTFKIGFLVPAPKWFKVLCSSNQVRWTLKISSNPSRIKLCFKSSLNFA